MERIKKQLTLQRAVVAILLMPWILPRKVNLRRKCITKAQKGGETCIDCHKGIAHFPPEIKMDDNAAHELESQAATSVTNGAHIYPFKTSRIGELATVNPGTDLTVVDASGKQPIVLLQGYQMQGSENTLYPGGRSTAGASHIK